MEPITYDYMEGRGKHLGQLGLVFRHRGGTWGDFGQFLRTLFSDSPSRGAVATTAPVIIDCRHNPGGRHHPILTASTQNPQAYPMFNHERYSRPCTGLGSFELGKNPGWVVADLCTRAQRFLQSIGKGGTIALDPGRDVSYNPADYPMSSPPSVDASIATDSQGSISQSNILDGPRVVSMPAEEDYGDDLFEDEDVVDDLARIANEVEGNVRPRTSSTMETPTGLHGSDDSILQEPTRSSTKMRVATLAYLWRFVQDPRELRTQFRLLRRDRSLHVLHLCGCGLCIQPSGGRRTLGCVERSHLMLGPKSVNDNHASHHQFLGLTRDHQYPRVIDEIHKAEDGAGLF